MLKKKKSTLSYLGSSMDVGSAVAMLVAFAAMLIVGTSCVDGNLSREICGYLLGFFSFIFVLSFFRPIIAMAAEGYDSLVQVVLATWLILGFAIGAWCFCYYLVTGALTSGSSGLKLLDVPTLLVAVGVASTGWYVSSQLTRRSHRTNHAVSMVLGSRTNGEFQKHSERVRRYLPDKASVDVVDPKYFGPLALKTAYNAYFASQTPATKAELQEAKAVESLKYMLNYYEFVAVGVRLGDIEERILYDTIGTHVCNLHDRAERLRKWMVAPDGGKQVLAFEYLDELVSRWRNMVADDEADRRKRTNGFWRG